MIKLEEMDWVAAEKRAKEMIREGLMLVEMGTVSFNRASQALKKLKDAMPEEERRKRQDAN